MEKAIIQQCARERIPLPKSIANAPELQLGLDLYYQAFFDLTTCRAIGQALEGPIPWSEVLKWATHYELDEEQREALFYHIAEMDRVYLDVRIKQLKKTKPKLPPVSKKGKK